jgi:hypothetical protein
MAGSLGRSRWFLDLLRSGWVRRQRRSGTCVIIALNELDIVRWEETPFTLRVGTHPPVLINHVDIGYVVALAQFDLVVFSLLVIVENNGTLAAAGASASGGVLVVMGRGAHGSGSGTTNHCSCSKGAGCNSETGTTSRVLRLDLRLRRKIAVLRSSLCK